MSAASRTPKAAYFPTCLLLHVLQEHYVAWLCCGEIALASEGVGGPAAMLNSKQHTRSMQCSGSTQQGKPSTEHGKPRVAQGQCGPVSQDRLQT